MIVPNLAILRSLRQHLPGLQSSKREGSIGSLVVGTLIFFAANASWNVASAAVYTYAGPALSLYQVIGPSPNCPATGSIAATFDSSAPWVTASGNANAVGSFSALGLTYPLYAGNVAGFNLDAAGRVLFAELIWGASGLTGVTNQQVFILAASSTYNPNNAAPNYPSTQDALIVEIEWSTLCYYNSYSLGNWSGTGLDSLPIGKSLGGSSTLTPSTGGSTAPAGCGCGAPDGHDPTPSSFVGDPIDSATGNNFQAETDLAAGSYTGLRLDRYYNSLDVSTSAFGSNWRSTWHRGLIQTATGVIAVRGNGRQLSFTNNAGVYTADSDVRETLSTATINLPLSGYLAQPGYALLTPDDEVETYAASGQLLTVTSRAGLVTTLNYNASNQLVSVVGPFGHTLSFAYDTNSRVSRMTAPDGGVFVYGYDASNNLVSVTYPDGSIRLYLYENAAMPHGLTGVLDENGNRFATWGYDGQGMAIASQHAAA